MNNFETIPQKIYNVLPPELKDACLYFNDLQEREAFLMSALTILGSSLSNYSGTYNGQNIYPTLQLFTVYHQPLQALQAATLLSFQLDKEHMRTYNNEKRSMEADGIKEAPPNWQRLIAVDTNYIHILNMLKDKDGLGLLYNTEGKMIPPIAADEDKTLLLNTAFHNRMLMYHTLVNSQNKCIDNLQLSVWLKGNYKDMQQVIPNNKHKLFPGFCYYIIDDKDTPLLNPFSTDNKTIDIIAPLIPYIFKLYNELVYESNRSFTLNEEKQKLFTKYTEGYTTNQMLIYYRIAMIVTMLQYYEHFKILSRHKELSCTEQALAIAYYICEVLNNHHKVVEEYLSNNGVDIPQQNITIQLTEEEQLAATLYEQGMSLRKIAIELYNDEGKFMKVKRMLARIGRAA
ncbi:MAG: hypothetical protein H6551_13385 [Chitinophagales bacterium]|nr:hypothetical protein [Chitinophagaceae bacterium]MCB9066126.1 hypothetical protein [Chitinophagales bacterium]